MIVKEAMEIIENTRYYYTPSEEQLFMYTEALEFYMANELDIKKRRCCIAGRKRGYVPEKDNIIFARLTDAGKLLKAKVTKKNQKGSFTQISIGIYLVDF